MQVACRLVAVLVLALSLCAVSVSAQPAPINVTFSTFDALVSRLHAAPFDPTLRDTIVASLRKSMPMFVFKDLALDSSVGVPDGQLYFPSNFDIMAEVEKFATQTFSSDYQMNNYLVDLFLPLNDAHTAYRPNTAAFAFLRPFRLAVRAERQPQGELLQRVYFRENTTANAIYKQVYGYEPLRNATLAGTTTPVWLPSIDNFEIISIDGQPALEYLWAGAMDQHELRVSLAKDPHTRFNLLTHGFAADEGAAPGVFSYRSLGRYGIPKKDKVVLTVRDPNSASLMYDCVFQWIGIAPAPTLNDFEAPLPAVSGSALQRQQQLDDHYWQLHSLQHEQSWQQLAALRGEPASPPPIRRAAPRPTAASIAAAARRGDLSSGNAFGIPGEISFTVLADNTGVLRINTFNPKDYKAFLQVLQQSVSNHQGALKGTKLIMDLRANGGGDICLGYATIRFLFPSLLNNAPDPNDVPYGRYDTIHSEVMSALAQLGAKDMAENLFDSYTCGEEKFFSPCSWVSPVTKLPFVDINWFDAGRELSRGGQTSAYTALFHDNCAEYYAVLAPSNINAGYKPDNLVLLSDGMCGSTCSVFSSFIQYNKLAKTVVLGGVLDDAVAVPPGPAQFWAFPGGQVIDIGELQELAAPYGVLANSTILPGAYPNKAVQRWAFREIYAWDDEVGTYPLEYLRVPAHFHFPYLTNFTDAAGIYQQLISDWAVFDMETCVPGLSVLGCPVAHGTGARPCVENRVQAECVAVSCDAGYVINAAGQCEACPAGTFRSAAAADQSSCLVCTMSADVVAPAGGVNCTGAWTSAAWTADNCPYSYSCASIAPAPGPSPAPAAPCNEGMKASTLWIVLGVTLSVIALLFIYVVYQWRQRRVAMSTGLDDAFSRM